MSILEAFYEPDGTVIFTDAGRIVQTKTIRNRNHWPFERHYYRYQPDPKHPEGRRTLAHLKGAECPPLPFP